MTMHDPSEARTGPELVSWLHDQVGAVKAHLARLQQQGEQLQAALLDVNEKLRDNDGRLREVTSKTLGLPVMHDQVRQLGGLLERIQDTEVAIDSRFELVERQFSEERTRYQAEKNDLYRRVQDLERRSEGIVERQSGVDDASRRTHEDVSRFNLQVQGFNQRLEGLETRAARVLDALTRLEQAHSETDSAIRSLRREDEVVAERARLAHEVSARVESELHTQAEEYRALPLLAERVELLRAERQRVEDRVSRMEEWLTDVSTRLEREEEHGSHLDARMKANDGRVEHVHGIALEYRRSLADQLLKLNQMMERMKRRQIEELERDVKDLRVQSNHLKNEENDF